MTKFIKGMLIDFDGTLVDTLPSLFVAYKNFLAAYGLEGNEEEFHSLIGPSLAEIVARLKKEKNLAPTHEELFAHYRKLVAESKGQMLPDLLPFLKYAQAKKMRLAVVTSAPSRWVNRLLKEHGIDHYFEFVLSGEDFKHGKPAPDIYLEAIKRINMPRESLLAVEDSVNGTKSSEGAGLKTLFPNWQEVLDVVSRSHFVELHKGPLVDFKVVEGDYSHLVNAEVENDWAMRLKKNKGLFNGPLLAFSHIKSGVLYAYMTDYKAYLGREFNGGIPVWPLSVTGITRFEDKVLYGKRADSLVKYPGAWEVVPSGGLSQLDAEDQILKELEEEVGVDKEAVVSVTFSKVIHNLDEDTVEMIYDIKLKHGDAHVTDEVTEVLWLTPPAKPPGPTIPLSLILC